MEQSHFKAQYKQMLSTYRQQKARSLFTKGTEAVVNKLIHAIESPYPKPKYLVTFPAHLLALLKRLLSIKMPDRLLIRFSRTELNEQKRD